MTIMITFVYRSVFMPRVRSPDSTFAFPVQEQNL